MWCRAHLVCQPSRGRLPHLFGHRFGLSGFFQTISSLRVHDIWRAIHKLDWANKVTICAAFFSGSW